LKRSILYAAFTPYQSRPTRARGLKLFYQTLIVAHKKVAPHAGAWIETEETRDRNKARSVAPHAGAWIETYNDYLKEMQVKGRAPRGRVD